MTCLPGAERAPIDTGAGPWTRTGTTGRTEDRRPREGKDRGCALRSLRADVATDDDCAGTDALPLLQFAALQTIELQNLAHHGDYMATCLVCS